MGSQLGPRDLSSLTHGKRSTDQEIDSEMQAIHATAPDGDPTFSTEVSGQTHSYVQLYFESMMILSVTSNVWYDWMELF